MTDDADALLEEAHRLRRDYRCNEALALFQQLLEHDPENAGAKLGLGLLLLDYGQPEVAYEIFEKLDSQDEDHRVALAGALVKLGRHREALTLLEPIVAASPDYTRAHLWIVEACFGLHQYQKADRHIALAYDANDQYPLVHYWAARLHTVAGKPELREREIAAALELQPSLYDAEVQLGSPDLDELEARARAKPYSGLLYALGLINQQETEDLSRSRSLLELVVASQPEDVNARLALGQTLLLLGDWSAAEELHRLTTELSPDEERAWCALATRPRRIWKATPPLIG